MKRLPLCLLLLFFQTLWAESVVWRSMGGHEFTGTFVGVQSGRVTLAGEDGATVTVPLQSLEPDSRQLALSMHQTATAGSKPASAPLFTHQGRNYVVAVYNRKNSFLKMEFRDRGRPLSYVKPDIRYTLAEIMDKQWTEIDLESVEMEHRSRQTVRFRLNWANGVVSRFTLELMDDGVGFSYRMEEPPADLPELGLVMQLLLPPLVEYDMQTQAWVGPAAPGGVPADQLENALSPYSLHVSFFDQPGRNLPFHEHHKGIHTLKQLRFREPGASKPTVFDVEGDGTSGHLSMWLYDGKLLGEGTHLRFLNSEPASETAPVFRIRHR